MEITQVKIRKIFTDPQNKVKAIASIVIDEEFTVHDLKVINGVERLFVAMPNRHSENGHFQDIAHPLNMETREKIERLVINAYMDVLQKQENKEIMYAS